MSYQIRKSDGDLVLTLAPGFTDRDKTSLALVGKNVTDFGKDQNENFIKLLENFSNTIPPVNSLVGQLWFNTDQDKLFVKTSTGFQSIGPFNSPSTPGLEEIGDDVATTAYVHAVLPKGSVIMWSGAIETVPNGWALCDGNNGNAINGQIIPDLRNKFVIGAGSTYPVASTGGRTTITEIPSHTHNFTGQTQGNNTGHSHSGVTNSAGVHNHVFPGDDQLFNANNQGGWAANSVAGFPYDARSVLGGGGRLWETTSAGNHNHTFTTGAESANHLHNFSGTTNPAGTTPGVDITNPYMALAYIIKVV